MYNTRDRRGRVPKFKACNVTGMLTIVTRAAAALLLLNRSKQKSDSSSRQRVPGGLFSDFSTRPDNPKLCFGHPQLKNKYTGLSVVPVLMWPFGGNPRYWFRSHAQGQAGVGSGCGTISEWLVSLKDFRCNGIHR